MVDDKELLELVEGRGPGAAVQVRVFRGTRPPIVIGSAAEGRLEGDTSAMGGGGG